MAAATTASALPPGIPLPSPIQTYLFWRWPLALLEHCRDHYGSSFTLRPIDHPPLVFLTDPNDIKAAFAASPDVLHPGQGAQTIEPIVGDGSFMLSEGDAHLRTRKAILPPLHAKVVSEHANRVTTIAKRAIEAWPRDVDVALHPRLRALALEVILHTLLGPGDLTGPEALAELSEKLLAMLAVTASPMLSAPALRRGPGRTIWERFLRCRAEVDDLLLDLIEQRRFGAEARPDALSALLRTHNEDSSRASNEQVRDDLMSLILAGHETTAAELSWAFQLLTHNPRVLSRLVNEIDNGSSERYLTATVHEILRHRPVFLFAMPRAVAQPIEIGDWSCEAPAQLLACIYLVHHDPRLYPQPQAFRPERFLEGSPATYTWLPWGGGRRRCPGLHLATLEIKTVLRVVLTNMTVTATARRIERPRWRSVIVTPHRGSRVVLSARAHRGCSHRRHTDASPRRAHSGSSQTASPSSTVFSSSTD